MTYFISIIVTFSLFLLAIALICISRLITGKMNVRIGSCGRVPTQKKDEKCGKDQTCPLCEKDKEK